MKHHPLIWLLIPGLLACTSPKTYRSGGTIEELDPRLESILKKDAKVEIIANGFEWSEGPVWIEDQKMLLFSDIPPNSIIQWNEEKGVDLYLNPSGYTGPVAREGEPGSNGLIVKDGKLILCQHGDRRIALMEAPLHAPQPQFKTLASQFRGKRFNSPNDAVIDKNGNIYFTDPPYGLVKGMEDPAKEMSWQGVYKLDTHGKVFLLVDSLTRPNGIALSPDQKFLYIGNSDGAKPRWYKYELGDTSLVSGRIFYDLSGTPEHGGPDGMKIDKNGNLFSSGPGGVWIFNAGGEVLGRIHLGQATSNVALDNEEKTLFITSDSLVLRVKMK